MRIMPRNQIRFNLEKLLIVLIIFPIFSPITTLPIYIRYPIIALWMLIRIPSIVRQMVHLLYPYLLWLFINLALFILGEWYFGHYSFGNYMYTALMYMFPILMYLSYSYDYKKTLLIRNTVLISLFLGTIITIIANLIVPGASRILAQGLTFSSTARMLSRWGCKDFSGIYASALFMPVILYNMRKENKERKVWWVLFFLTMVMIFVSNYTTALLLAFLAIIIHFSIRQRAISIITAMVISILLLIIPSVVYADFLLFIRNIVGGTTELGSKLYDISLTIRTNEPFGTVSSRSEVYLTSLESFRSSILFGGITNNEAVSGDHSSIFDLLACFGLMGFAIYMWHLFKIMGVYIKGFSKKGQTIDARTVLMVVFGMYILLAIFNPIVYSTTIVFAVFIAVPATLRGGNRNENIMDY